MSTQPIVLSAHVSLATAKPPWGRRPTLIGRKPHGSRTAITRSPTSATSENAPFHAGRVRSMRSSHVLPPAAASISVSTSVSLVAVRPKPRDSSSSRSAAVFTRLPLWASASGPCIVSTRNGWMLRRLFAPVVL
jgi:hypothetical protein